MSDGATLDGTKKYAESFRERAADGHFREVQGLVLSSLGIGTYLGQPDERTDAAYTTTIVAAVENGINVVDAAINYRFQRSERSIGAALVQLEQKGFRARAVGPLHQSRIFDAGRQNAERPQQIFFRRIYTARNFYRERHCGGEPLHGP